MWEEFHLKWLEEGNDIMIVIFEHLTNKELLHQTLDEISTFLNFASDENRLMCTINHSEGRFHRKEKCIRKKRVVAAAAVRAKNVSKDDVVSSSSFTNDNVNDIFTGQQKRKINQAIKNVNDAIVKRDLTPLPIDDYENTVIRLNLCP